MFIRRWVAERIGAYRLFPAYIAGVKKTGWEIAWGDGLLAIIFGLYSLRYTVSWEAIAVFFGGAFFIAGYHIWRAEHIRLQPKLEFAQQVFSEQNKYVPINSTNVYERIDVQVLPQCCSDVPVEHCRGRLLRVLKWSNGRWQPTTLSEPLDLIWSFHGSDPITLEPGVPQRLNLLAVTNNVEVQVDPKPIKAHDVFVVNHDFRLDVIVTGRDCPAINISVKIRFHSQPLVGRNLLLPFDVSIIGEPNGNCN